MTKVDTAAFDELAGEVDKLEARIEAISQEYCEKLNEVLNGQIALRDRIADARQGIQEREEIVEQTQEGDLLTKFPNHMTRKKIAQETRSAIRKTYEDAKGNITIQALADIFGVSWKTAEKILREG